MTIRNEILEEITKLRTNVDGLLGYLDALDATLAPAESEPVVDTWPKMGDDYWAVMSSGGLRTFTHVEGVADDGRISRGNVFRTKEEAEKADRITLAMHELKVMSEKEWVGRAINEDTIYYYAYHLQNAFGGEWLFDYHNYKVLGVVYFHSPIVAVDAHKAVDAKYEGILR